MTSASDIMRFLRRLGASGEDGRAIFSISASNSLQKSSAIQKISVTLLSVIMICTLKFVTYKLLNINEITKRIGDFSSCRFNFFKVCLIPNSRILVHYFDENEIEDCGKVNCNIVVSKPELSDEDKAEIRQQAMEQFKKEQLDALCRQSQTRKSQPKATATAPKAGEEINVQPSLFDL